jgi:hypothetical protein
MQRRLSSQYRHEKAWPPQKPPAGVPSESRHSNHSSKRTGSNGQGRYYVVRPLGARNHDAKSDSAHQGRSTDQRGQTNPLNVPAGHHPAGRNGSMPRHASFGDAQARQHWENNTTTTGNTAPNSGKSVRNPNLIPLGSRTGPRRDTSGAQEDPHDSEANDDANTRRDNHDCRRREQSKSRSTSKSTPTVSPTGNPSGSKAASAINGGTTNKAVSNGTATPETVLRDSHPALSTSGTTRHRVFTIDEDWRASEPPPARRVNPVAASGYLPPLRTAAQSNADHSAPDSPLSPEKQDSSEDSSSDDIISKERKPKREGDAASHHSRKRSRAHSRRHSRHRSQAYSRGRSRGRSRARSRSRGREERPSKRARKDDADEGTVRKPIVIPDSPEIKKEEPEAPFLGSHSEGSIPPFPPVGSENRSSPPRFSRVPQDLPEFHQPQNARPDWSDGHANLSSPYPPRGFDQPPYPSSHHNGAGSGGQYYPQHGPPQSRQSYGPYPMPHMYQTAQAYPTFQASQPSAHGPAVGSATSPVAQGGHGFCRCPDCVDRQVLELKKQVEEQRREVRFSTSRVVIGT